MEIFLLNDYVGRDIWTRDSVSNYVNIINGALLLNDQLRLILLLVAIS